MNEFDICIVGAGVAGVFAFQKLAIKYPDLNIGIFDFGRPPAKRRRQIEGWLGCLPNSDGKFYMNDTKAVEDITKTSSLKVLDEFTDLLSKSAKTVENTDPSKLSVSLTKKLKKFNYKHEFNNYISVIPKDIHLLSKQIVNSVDSNKNLFYNFDEDVKSITKPNDMFEIATESKIFKSKKVLFCVGRSGWRFAQEIYSKFGIIKENNIAKYGIKIEVASDIMKEFNHTRLYMKKGDVEIGPLSWDGTVIPEDHYDIAITAFRSNEARWKSDKVSFDFVKSVRYENKGFEELDRISKLTFLLCGDRAIKEKLSLVQSKHSKLSIMKEYSWLLESLEDFANVVPEIINKGSYHIPTIITLAPKIDVHTNFETDIKDFYVAGESAGKQGLLFAALSGLSVAEELVKS